MVALGGVTPECPRVGIPYSRCPSPTSTWGAATSRLAAVAIILIPSACRRLIVPATSQTLLCRLPSPPLPLASAAEKEKERERERTAPLTKPATTTTTPTLHATTAHQHINHHHVPPPTTTRHPSRVILVKVNESKVFYCTLSFSDSWFCNHVASCHITPMK